MAVLVVAVVFGVGERDAASMASLCGPKLNVGPKRFESER